MAREWVASKLRNQADFLDELYQRRPSQTQLFVGPIETIRSSVVQFERVEGTFDDQRGRMLGLEGSAGRAYFTCLGKRKEERGRDPFLKRRSPSGVLRTRQDDDERRKVASSTTP